MYVEVDCFFYMLYLTPDQAGKYGLKHPPRPVNLSKLQRERDAAILSFMREWR